MASRLTRLRLAVACALAASLPALAIFAGALLAAFRWKAKTAVVWIVAGAAAVGALWMD